MQLGGASTSTAISPGGSLYLVKTNHDNSSRQVVNLISRPGSSASVNNAAIGIMTPSVAPGGGGGSNFHTSQQSTKLGQMVVQQQAPSRGNTAIHISQSQSHNSHNLSSSIIQASAAAGSSSPAASAFHFQNLPQPNMTAKSQTSLPTKSSNMAPQTQYFLSANGTRTVDFNTVKALNSQGFSSSSGDLNQSAGTRIHAPATGGSKNKVMVLPSYLAQPEYQNQNTNNNSLLAASNLDHQQQYRATGVPPTFITSAQSGITNVATTSHMGTSTNGLPMAPNATLGSGNQHALGMSQHDDNYDSSVTSSLEPNEGVFNAYISLRNVVASFQVKCYLTLRTIALNAQNVEYKRESGRVMMKLRKPEVTANIWSSGRITCTGAKSSEEAKVACRRVARILQKLNFNVKFCKFKVNNVLATTSFPFGVKLHELGEKGENVQYEPELHPAALVRFPNLHGNAIAKIFATGSVTLTANSVQAIQDAVVLLYPVLEPFKTAKPLPNQTSGGSRKRPGRNGGRNRKAVGGAKYSGAGMEDYDFDSDDSQCSEDL